MEVFRLCRAKYAAELNGKGAAISGGRWNSPGVEMIYTAANRSLAMAEVLVHLSLAGMPDDFMMMTICLPDDMPIKEIKARELPAKWNFFPYLNVGRTFGDQFIRANAFCVLKVPSAVTQGDYNFLINPHHADFRQISIVSCEKFPFDRRVFR